MPKLPQQVIDAHLHWHSINEMKQDMVNLISKEFPQLKSAIENPDSPKFILNLLDSNKVEKAFVINYMSPYVMGYKFSTNDWVSEFCEKSDGRLVPFGGVDPSTVSQAGQKILPYLESGRINGIKFHPPHMRLFPNDYKRGNESMQSLLEVCNDLEVPVLFHTGSSIFKRAVSRFGNPLELEDVLIDFPNIKAVMAHGGRPFWQREAEYLMSKFPKLTFDISGIPPKYLEEWYPRIRRYMDRLMYGSDFPSPGVPGIRENAIAVFQVLEKLGASQSQIDRVFYGNASSLIREK